MDYFDDERKRDFGLIKKGNSIDLEEKINFLFEAINSINNKLKAIWNMKF